MYSITKNKPKSSKPQRYYRGLPVVEARWTRFLDGDVEVTCPYCGGRHFHGLAGHTPPCWLGHRGADCPGDNRGYYVWVPEDWDRGAYSS